MEGESGVSTIMNVNTDNRKNGIQKPVGASEHCVDNTDANKTELLQLPEVYYTFAKRIQKKKQRTSFSMRKLRIVSYNIVS